MKRLVSPPVVYLVAAVVLSVGYGCYVFALSRVGAEPAPHVGSLFRWVFAAVIAMWVVADSRNREGIYRPFEYGFFVIIFAIPYLPYYLFKTRGVVGVAWLLGILVLFFSGLIAAAAGGSAA